jgi:cytoskeletal protein RodZ
MNSEVKDIGELFKNRRKELNIMTLKEVENATSIRSVYLQAIEEGEFDKLISPIYAQGFLRQYANFLGIDGDAIIRENAKHFNRQDNQEFSYGIGTLEMRGSPGGSVRWVPNLLWIGAFAGLFFAAWYIAKFFELV